MKRATMRNQHAKNKNARDCFHKGGRVFCTPQLELETSNKRYSTDLDGMKQAGLNMPEIRLNFNVATRHQSACRLFIN